MSEPEIVKTDYDRLVDEFRRTAGPLESLTQFITDGIEMEVFVGTLVGKIFLARALKAARAAIEQILDPNTGSALLSAAIAELRVQHRLLDVVASTITVGRSSEHQVKVADGFKTPTNPDEDPEL